MNNSIVFTFICDDKPGITDAIATTVSTHQGNWLESNLSHMAGKFAGVVHVSVPEEHSDALLDALQQLSGFEINAKRGLVATEAPQKLAFNVVGNDRPGIVREITQAFAKRHINIERFKTQCSSAPHTGIPLFEADGIAAVPESLDRDELEDTLDRISNELAVDIELSEI